MEVTSFLDILALCFFTKNVGVSFTFIFLLILGRINREVMLFPQEIYCLYSVADFIYSSFHS
jgi:hypothetical protein